MCQKLCRLNLDKWTIFIFAPLLCKLFIFLFRNAVHTSTTACIDDISHLHCTMDRVVVALFAHLFSLRILECSQICRHCLELAWISLKLLHSWIIQLNRFRNEQLKCNETWTFLVILPKLNFARNFSCIFVVNLFLHYLINKSFN